MKTILNDLNLCIAIILVTSCLNTSNSNSLYKIDDFTGGYFKIVSVDAGVYNLDVGFSKETIGKGEKVMAYGDLNNNGSTDIVTVTQKDQTINIYVYDEVSQGFKKETSIKNSSISNGKIISIILTDLNGDKSVDLLVTVRPANTKIVNQYTLQRQENSKAYILNNDFTLENQRHQQPFVFTVYSDEDTTNSVYNTYILLDNDAGVRYLNYYDNESKSFIKNKPFIDLLVKNQKGCLNPPETFLPIDQYTGSVFIDMNADCRPDILISSLEGGRIKKQEYYLYTGNGFCLVDIKTLNDGSNPTFSMPSFADFNSRGTNDMIMISSDSTKPGLKVNIYKNMHTSNKDDLCSIKNQNNLDFPYPGLGKIGSGDNLLTFDLPIAKDYNMYYDNENLDFPAVIQIGDLDLDGIPDMTLVLYQGTDFQKSKCHTFAFQGIKCSSEQLKLVFPDGATKTQELDCLYFDRSKFDKEFGHSSYEAVNTQSTSYFDFGEIGSQGLVSEVYDPASDTISIGTYFNFLRKGNYFLKAMAKTNGKAFGNTYIGLNYLAIRTDTKGEQRVVANANQFGVSHTRNQLPFVLFGLGRINNYIEDFTAGVAKKENFFKKWTPIIPNSQLIITPPIGKSDWNIEIYINPTKAMSLIIISTLIVLFVIGVVIVIYHVKEKEQDRKANESAYIPFI